MATKLHKRKRSDQEVEHKKAKLNLNPGEQNNTDLDKLNEVTLKNTPNDKQAGSYIEQNRRRLDREFRGGVNAWGGVNSQFNQQNWEREGEQKSEEDKYENEQRFENNLAPQPKPSPEKQPKWLAEAKPEPKPEGGRKRKREAMEQNAGANQESKQNQHSFSTPFSTNMLKTRPEPE